jgi:hypothetical protein
MVREPFEAMLTGGHPNSLGRTVEVVDAVLADPERLEELFACYGSSNEVVRLRVSSAMKRIAHAQPALVVPYIDRMLGEVAGLQQASAQWTLAQLFLALEEYLSPQQKRRAVSVMQCNLETWGDWIVLIQTMTTLAAWAKADPELAAWLRPHLERLGGDPRASVSRTARRELAGLAG